MKSTVLLLLVVFVINRSFSQNNNLTNQDLKITCQVLAKLSNLAIDKNRKDLLSIYYNAYQAIKSEQNFTDNCDDYFSQIKSNYSSSIGRYSMSIYSFPPKLDLSSGLGGFTHKDIDILTKFNELNISDEDVGQLLFFKELRNNNVDINLLKNTNTENIRILNNKLTELNLNNLNQAKLNSLPKNIYEIKEFSSVTK